MASLRTIVLSTIFGAVAVGGYSLANSIYAEESRKQESDSRAIQGEIKTLLPHIKGLLPGIAAATDNSRFLWRDTYTAIGDAEHLFRHSRRPDPVRECDILLRLNEINLATGAQYRFTQNGNDVLRTCIGYAIRNHKIPRP